MKGAPSPGKAIRWLGLGKQLVSREEDAAQENGTERVDRVQIKH